MDIQLPSQPISTVYLAGYVLAGIISAALTLYVIRYRRQEPVARAFGIVCFLLVLWAVGYIGRMVVPDLHAKLLWTQVAWIGISFVPVGMFAFVLIFTGRGRYLSRRRVALLAVIPILTQVMLFTNEYHYLFYEEVWLYVEEPTPFIASQGGSYFYGVHVPYSWTLVAISTVLLIQFAFATPHVFRTQSLGLLIGAIAPWIAHGTFISGVRFHPELDPTPLGYGIGLLAISIAVFRSGFLGLVPVARERVLDEMDACIIVVDNDDRIVDLNRAGETFLREFSKTEWQLGDSIDAVLPACISNERGTTGETEVELPINDESTWYLLREYPLESEVYAGSIVSLIDINEQKRQQLHLQQATEQLATERDGKEAIRRLLLDTSTAQELARQICRFLVDEREYAAAWVFRSLQDRPGTDSVTLLASHGQDGGFIPTDGRADPVTRLARQSEDVATVTRDTELDVREQLMEADLDQVTAIPLHHQDVSYGTIVVAGDRPDGRYQIDVVEEFADAIAFKLFIAQQQTALTTDSVYEVVLEITGEHFLVELAQAIDLPNGEYLQAHELDYETTAVTYLIEYPETQAVELPAEELETDTIIAGSVSEGTPEQPVRELTVEPPTIGSVVSNYGGMLHAIVATTDHVEATVQFPRRTDIGEVIEAVQSIWENATVRSKLRKTVGQNQFQVFDDLSPKEERALRAAVRAGFFERPQRANATDVGETLGVSRTTFLRHLREAERKVFGQAFRHEPSSEDP